MARSADTLYPSPVHLVACQARPTELCCQRPQRGGREAHCLQHTTNQQSVLVLNCAVKALPFLSSLLCGSFALTMREDGHVRRAHATKHATLGSTVALHAAVPLQMVRSEVQDDTCLDIRRSQNIQIVMTVA